MTKRHEAIEKIEAAGIAWSEELVDALAALGLLKLDDPKLVARSSPEYRLYDAIFEHVPTLDFMPFKQLIEQAGLKIVEK